MRTVRVAVLVAVLLLVPMAQASLGTYGSTAGPSTVGLAGMLTGDFPNAQIVYRDTGSITGVLEPGEAVFLDLQGTGTVGVGDIQLTTVGPGTAGSHVTIPITANIQTDTGGVPLNDLLRFKDSLPTYANGGPDGAFNPGEILFIDVNNNGLLDSGDIILSGGTPGARQTSTDADNIWHAAGECIYQGAPTVVSVGMRRITACGAFVPGSAVEPGDGDLGSSLTTISNVVITVAKSRTITGGGIISGSSTVTAPAASFTADDVGSAISGQGIPTNTWITAFTSDTEVTISVAATSTNAAVTLTVNPTGSRSVPGATTTSGSATVTTAAPAFSAFDVGRTITGSSGSGIPSNSIITVFDSPTSVNISSPATASVAGTVTLTLGSAATLFQDGEDAWIGSGTVNNGHFRLTDTPGTVVDCVISAATTADADCGTPTTSITNAKITRTSDSYPAIPFPDVGFLDLQGDGVYGFGDRVYFDFDGNGFVSPADVRVNAGTPGYGTRPVLGDFDTRAVLGNAFPTAQVLYLDTGAGGIGSIGPSEILALDLNGNGHFDFGDVPLVTGSGCTAGLPRQGTTTCGMGGTWKTAASATTPGTLCFHDGAPAGANRGDGLYLRIGAGGCTTVSSGDLRITQTVLSASGQVLPAATRVPTSNSPDLGLGLTAVTLGTTHTLRNFDADGSGARSPGDLLYLELLTGNGEANQHDARLHNQHGLSFGHFLSANMATAKDTVLRFTPLDTPDPAFAFFPVSSPAYTPSEDPVLLRLNPTAPCGVFVAQDVLISAGIPSQAAGTSVAGGFHAGKPCTDLPGASFAFYPSAQPFSGTSTLIAKVVAGGTVSIGDVRLSASSPGSKYGGSDPDLSTPVTVITLGDPLAPRTGSVTIAFLDLNGYGVPETSVPLVLDIDGNGVYSTGDVLLSGTGGTTSLALGTTSPGGGPTTPPTTDPTTTASPSPTPTTSPSPTPTPTTTPGPDDPGQTVIAWNLAIQASLTVRRDGADNVLSWTPQAGATGYQVFRTTSPWTPIADLRDGGASTYRDVGASVNAKYLVTAYFVAADGTTTGFVGDPTTQDVPGLGVDPEGKGLSRVRSPGPGLLAAFILLGAAVVMARRRA